MKRVLCLIANMNAGGAETFLMKIYRTLDRSQYQMDFCVNTKEKCFYEDEILSMGGKIYRIPSKSENIKEFKKQLSAVIRDNGYKYMLRITSSAMGFMDLKIAKKAGAEVCIARSSNASDGGGVKAYIAHRLGRMLYGHCADVKIAPSDLAAEYTFGKKTYRNGKVNILHNAIDINLFRYSEEKRNSVRKEFGISENAKVIGHIGRFMTQKNHGFLIDVFSEIRKKDSSAVLFLVGKGELEEEIRQKIKSYGLESSVIFAGVRSDIPAVLSAMDMFVFPSFYEGMPNTVIEAQATGLPCIIADTITKEARITELVEYLSLEKNAEEWANAALSAYPQKRIDVRNDFIKAVYDIESVTKQFVDLVFKNVK